VRQVVIARIIADVMWAAQRLRIDSARTVERARRRSDPLIRVDRRRADERHARRGVRLAAAAAAADRFPR
jgi:hypothetical protein